MSTETRTTKIDFRPGINRELTRLAGEGGWYDADKVRFRFGKAENMRGYQKRVSSTFNGTGREIMAWVANDGNRFTAFGTECQLHLYDGGNINDITPVRASATHTSLVNTSLDSTRIVVSVAHGITSRAYIHIVSAVGVATSLQGNTYEASMIDDNSYAFDATVSATGTSAGVGTVRVDYLLNCGATIATEGLGYGTGRYDVSAYGDARAGSGIFIDMHQWSMDKWGEDLIANPRGGGIYLWDRTSGVGVRASVITSAPVSCNSIIVSPIDRHLVALGTRDLSGNFDPMLVRWCDQEDYNDWTPSTSSTSGDVRLQDGSKIVGGILSRNQILVGTDTALYGMEYIGPPFTFGIQQLGANCGLSGPHSITELNGRAFWMGNSNFYMFDGRVQIMPCTVLRFVFDNYNSTQHDKVFAAANEEFGEIIWLYPSAAASECDRYVIFNTIDMTWTIGTCKWTVWEDRGVYSNVITLSSDHYIYDNEPANTYTADGAALESYIESADYDLGDGDDIAYVDRVIPDVNLTTGAMNISIVTKMFPNGAETTKGPYTITTSTGAIRTRARGRILRTRFATSTAGTVWRLGSPRIDIAPDGKR